MSMEFWIITILATLIISCLIFFIKIYINLKYYRDGSNDYIFVNVYIHRKILAYTMQIPIIEFDGSKWLDSKIETGKSQDKTNVKRKQRFVKKTVRFYMKYPGRFRRVARLFRSYARLYSQAMDNFTQSFHCEQLYWKTVYGSEDAALTGIGVGVLWAIKALMITRLKRKVVVIENPIISVNPVFGDNRFNVDFQCIFSIRLGNVINAIRMLNNIKR